MMKPENYNPKAREAFGKSLVDGVSLFKAVILLITVLPATLIVKGASGGESVSVLETLGSMSPATFFTVLVLLSVGILLGLFFRQAGLKHIHELEN